MLSEEYTFSKKMHSAELSVVCGNVPLHLALVGEGCLILYPRICSLVLTILGLIICSPGGPLSYIITVSTYKKNHIETFLYSWKLYVCGESVSI